MKPRIVLADDHPLVLEGLRRVLETEFDIVGVALNGRELIATASATKPDVAILDIGMPLMNGIEAARQLKSERPSLKIVFITQMEDREYIRRAFDAGASAFILKQAVTSDLNEALRAVLNGRIFLSPTLRPYYTEEALRHGISPGGAGESLTQRQREVLQLVAEGLTGKEIANTLSISPRTVEFHKDRLMETLGIQNTAQLIRYAVEHGFSPSSKLTK